MAERDFLDKMIAKRTARNPEFPHMLDAARRRRELLRTLAERRERQNQTQTAVAAAMSTSQSFFARLESTAGDARSRQWTATPTRLDMSCSTISSPPMRGRTNQPSWFIRLRVPCSRAEGDSERLHAQPFPLFVRGAALGPPGRAPTCFPIRGPVVWLTAPRTARPASVKAR